MKYYASKDFSEKCLAAIEGAAAEGVVIMRDGRPIARLVPIASDQQMPTGGDVIREYKNKIKLDGDVFSTGVWSDAEFGHTYHPVRDQSDIDAEGASRD